MSKGKWRPKRGRKQPSSDKEPETGHGRESQEPWRLLPCFNHFNTSFVISQRELVGFPGILCLLIFLPNMSQHVLVRVESWSPSPAPQPAAGCSWISNHSLRSWAGGLMSRSQTSASALSSCHPHSPAPLWQPARFRSTSCRSSLQKPPTAEAHINSFSLGPIIGKLFARAKSRENIDTEAERGWEWEQPPPAFSV